MINNIKRGIGSVLGWTTTEKFLFTEAILYLFLAKIVLILFSFKFCLRLLKCKNCVARNDNPQNLQAIKTAINRANMLSFWKNVCLVQSFAARWMLNRRKISSKLSIGVAHDKNKKLIAHAWIKVGDFEIVNKGLNYKELYFI